MNEKYIDSLYLKAFETIRATFKNPGTLIQWASDRLDEAHEHSKCYKFIGTCEDLKIDVHYPLCKLLEISIGWVECNSEKINKTIMELYRLRLSEGFYHAVSQTLSIAMWYKTNFGMENQDDFLEVFKGLIEVAFIFEEIEASEQKLRKAS